MFTRADAAEIRRGLGGLDLTSSNAEPLSSVFDAYFKFYKFAPSVIGAQSSHTAGIIHAAGFDVLTQYFKPTEKNSRGTVVLLHGYFDHAGIYQHVIKHCLDQGLGVVIFDMPGHGLSSGEVASIESFDVYCKVLLRLLESMQNAGLPGPWHLLGQSTGAAVMIDCLLKNLFSKQFPLTKFIALAPLLRPYAWQTSRLLFSLSRLFLSSTKRKFSENSHDRQFLDFLNFEDPLQSRRLMRDWILAMMKNQQQFALAQINQTPLHIIQGTADTTVDWQYNLEKFKSKFPNTLIEQIPGARHHLVNESEAYRGQVFAAVDRALGLI
ncbi:MAG: alpha-beta hydrolase superfamily lysophospholipase [Pseudohongiellaceae bacterium]|jgi:alpha-beta hydrolase superfamily lysophospholipase